MYRDIRLSEIIKPQLNIDKIKTPQNETFINYLQHSIAKEKEKNMPVYIDVRPCPVCGKQVDRSDMSFTRDCHGITYRLVCWKCYDKLMEKGYDGEYYTEFDECLD